MSITHEIQILDQGLLMLVLQARRAKWNVGLKSLSFPGLAVSEGRRGSSLYQRILPDVEA